MFNVRVYGVLIDKEKGVLVSDELIRGKMYTKFPGGGLEYGEGTRDCLKREFLEEMDLKIEVKDHLYTTDFFQESAFKAGDQIISIYYYASSLDSIVFPLTNIEKTEKDSVQSPHADQETFRFIPFKELSEKELDLPIDKIVAEIVMKRFETNEKL